MKVTRVRARYRTPPALRPVDLSMWRNVALLRSCPPCSGALAPSSCPITLRASPVACVVTCGYCLSDVDSFHDAVDLGVDRSSVTPRRRYWPSAEAHALGCIVATLAGSMLLGLKQVSAIENRPAADRSRSRDFLPRQHFCVLRPASRARRREV